MNELLVLPPSQSIIIWRTSFISVVSIGYSIYYQKYDLCIISSGLMINSLNYWKHPLKHSWYRYLDILFAQIALYYEFYCIYLKKKYFLYLLCFIGIQCYILSRNIRNTKYNISIHGVWLSTLLHCGIHILGNILNILLF
jgi:hypothetical protein